MSCGPYEENDGVQVMSSRDADGEGVQTWAGIPVIAAIVLGDLSGQDGLRAQAPPEQEQCHCAVMLRTKK